jgi:hypothetical protein
MSQGQDEQDQRMNRMEIEIDKSEIFYPLHPFILSILSLLLLRAAPKQEISRNPLETL